EVASAEALEARLATLQAQGLLQTAERAALLELAKETLRHPQLAQWFSGDYQHWNERSIILANGRTLRPDKVLVGKDETIVLDFKFTQNEDESHLKQVAGYQSVLREMGMPNVKGYLYYGATGKLVAV